ncbi:2Fe-2S iron-sulfur cluster-binding protein [Streptomyces sp. NPDC007100]|uniref:2Fe-2S iron-sulfur cluster-binding protein n=1 Tax=Streptomyces sp. NPDC007100 TaxID=3155602 RepID=UPI0033E35B1B
MSDADRPDSPDLPNRRNSPEDTQPLRVVRPQDRQRWEPLPQGNEYESEATAFVQLPEGFTSGPYPGGYGYSGYPDAHQGGSGVPDGHGGAPGHGGFGGYGADPLAAPGHGYTPPSSFAPPTPSATTDPAATGQWTMPFTDAPPAVDLPANGVPGGHYADGGQDGAPHAVWPDAGTDGSSGTTGQWAIPTAPDEVLEESGEYLLGDDRNPASGYGGGYGHAEHGQGYGHDQAATGHWNFAVDQHAGTGHLPQDQRPADQVTPGYDPGLGGTLGGGAGNWSLPADALAQWPPREEPRTEPRDEAPAHVDVPPQPAAGEDAAQAETPAPEAVADEPPSDEPVRDEPALHEPAHEPAHEPEPGAAGVPAEAPAEARTDAAVATGAPEADTGGTTDPPPAEDGLQAGPADATAPAEPEPEPAREEPTVVAAPATAEESPAEPEPEPEPAPEPEPVAATAAPEPPAASAEAPAAEPADTVDVPDATDAVLATPAPDAADTTDTDRFPAEPYDEHPHTSYVLTVNGTDRPVTDAWIGESLLYVLRERLGLAGAKDGCSQGECGACSVQVDGRLVASCLVPAATTAGSEVRTVEGLAQHGAPSDVQCALAESGAVQCGFCIPGMAMTVHDLLEGNHAPTELETRQALCGNLCRCSGYRGVLDAVNEVVRSRAEAAAAAEEAAAAAPDQPGTPRIPHQAGPADPQSGGSA